MQWLKKAWDWVKGLVGSAAPESAFTPDLSLIRDYERGLQTNIQPYLAPYVSHFSRGDKHLYYIAAEHGLGPDNPTFETVRAVMAKNKPQLVIIEGLDSQSGLSPKRFANYVSEKAAQNFSTSEEPAYSASLAMKVGVPFMGGEPTDKEIFAQMEKKGYSEKDMVAHYVLRWIPRWVAQEGVTETGFDQKTQEYLDHLRYYEEQHTPPGQRLTVDEFKAWYKLHNDRPKRSFLQLDSQDLAPVRSQDASYFERMSADISEVREKHLDTQIAKAFANHDRVLVVYGGGHLAQSSKVFENMFGNVEHIKIAKSEHELPCRTDWSKRPRNQPGCQPCLQRS